MTPTVKNNKQRGTALVLTLWLLALLSAMALSFSLSVRNESAVTRNFKQSTAARALAMDAIENTVAYILADKDMAVDYLDEDDTFRTDAVRPPAPAFINTGGNTVAIKLSAEDAKLNINRINEKILLNLLMSADINEEDARTMAASLLDWIDADDLHRLDGAEDDYYAPLGYTTAGRQITVPGELLLIKGFSDRFGKGDEAFEGLEAMITTFGQSLNINMATPEVLEAMGLDPVAISSLIETRTSNKGLRNVPPALARAGTTSTSVYRIEARATMKESPETYVITSIVERVTGSEGQQLKTIYWKEDIETGGA